MTEIELRNIVKCYGAGKAAVRAVDNVSVTVAPGEFFFLLGPSGCGKTTLLRIIAGLIEPTAGATFFNNADVTALPVEKRNTAMVFQSYALWPHMTVMQNVEFGPKMRRLATRERLRIAEAALTRVEMEQFGRRKPNQLSGGQQQRVALARALAAEPACLLLDEPLSNLDARLRLHMRQQLRQLVKDTSTTAIYVTHDQKEALSMADRIAVMDSGRIVQVGTPQDIYRRPASKFVADFLGEANFIEGRASACGGQIKVETPVGTIFTADQPLPPDGAVTCCVRPERITMAASDSGGEGACRLAAKVESSVYLGEIRQYTLRLGQVRWRVSLLADDAAPLAAGADVFLQFAPQDITLLSR